MIRTMLTAATLLAATPVMAQTAPAAPVAAPVDPARAAAAEKAVAALVPKGVYMRMMRDQFPRIMDAMMTQMAGMRPSDLGVPGGKAGDEPMMAAAEKQDPYFRQRMAIMTKVMGEEMGTIFDRMEPRIRVGLAKAFARRFTLAQLTDLNAFFATPSGAAFANDYLLTFMDPELMQEMVALMPEMLKAMPAMMEKVQKATADLPPPPAKKDAK